jgi:iduronate 2-sulfatase
MILGLAQLYCCLGILANTAELSTVQQGKTEGEEESQPNVLFIMIDDLRNDLGALGVAHARTPHLDAFAATGRLFAHHYAQVPTCGASRHALLRGQYPTRPVHLGNNAIRDTQKNWAEKSLPNLFRRHGYKTLALGKVTHYPGGQTGRFWSEGPEELAAVWDRSWVPNSPWETPESMMHGYANGRPRDRGKSLPWEAFDGPDSSYPDAWIAEEAVATLQQLATSKEPWFFVVGFFKPHLPFAAPKKWFDLHDPENIAAPEISRRPDEPSSWHQSGEFRGNYGHEGRDPADDPAYARLLRHAYAAATSYVDAQAGRLFDALNRLQLSDRTIVVVWSDHGFLLGEHAIWGKHTLYEEALRAPLIIRHPGLKKPGAISRALVESVDIFPSLLDLCGLPALDHLDGKTLRPHLEDPSEPSRKPALGFWTNGRRTVRTDRWRLIVHPGTGENGQPGLELFDYKTAPVESRNIAHEQPEIVNELLQLLDRAPAQTGE